LIPPSLDYAAIKGMSEEARDIFIEAKPVSIVSLGDAVFCELWAACSEC
jgi:tRNA U34 5-carboxymethylaminomethyl modifying enzyme MnmG/GidA